MKLIIITVFIISMTDSKKMGLFWAYLSNRLQQSCLNLTNSESKFKPELQAIACGQSIQASQHNFEIKRLGLIHIFVVSGAHFATLQVLLSTMSLGLQKIFPHRRRQWWPLRYFKLCFEYLLLAVFLLGTGLQAPALRSFLQSIERGFLPWAPVSFLILSAGLLSFAWIPTSQHLSLQLSWYCALILAWPGAHGARGFFIRALLLFLGCSYFLSTIGTGSLMGVLSNLFLAPFISIGLFPLALLSLGFPSTIFLFDMMMRFFYFVSSTVSPDFYFQNHGGVLKTSIHWILLGSLHFLLHLQHVLQHRRIHD